MVVRTILSKTKVSVRCLTCCLLTKHKLEKYNPKELRKLADIDKIKKRKKVSNGKTITNKSIYSLE